MERVAWAGWVAAGVCLRVARGMFSWPIFPYLGALGTVLGFALSRRPSGKAPSASALDGAIIACLASLTLLPGVMYWRSAAALATFRVVAGAATLAYAWNRRRPVVWGALGALAVITLVGSPQPGIDVWQIATEAAQALLGGRNPYPLTFTDIYGGRYPYPARFNYWPGDLWASTASYAVFGEIRVVLAAAMAATAALTAYWLRRRGWTVEQAGRLSLLGAVHPVAFFQLEQAWVDPLMAPFFLAALLALDARRPVALGPALAGLVSVKQTALIPLFFLALAGARAFPPRALLRGVAAFAAAVAVAWGPFLALDARAFYEATILHFVAMPPRPESFSVAVILNRFFGFSFAPGAVEAGVAALGVFSGTWVFLGRWTAAQATLATTAALFLFGKVSFCNYHWWLGWLGLIALAERAAVPSSGSWRPGNAPGPRPPAA